MDTNVQKEVEQKPRTSYKLVFFILAALTVLEVGVSYLPGGVKTPILIITSITKALLVLLFFMHLKYDRRLYSAPILIGLFFVIPLILTIVLVTPYLSLAR